MNIKEECCAVESGKIIQRDENKRSFRIINKGELPVKICAVDGCLITDGEIRCDLLFIVDAENNGPLFLVELKGVDHVHALRQIINAAEQLDIRSYMGKKHSAIAASPAPKATTTYQNELRKLNKRFRTAGLEFPIKKNNVVEVNL